MTIYLAGGYSGNLQHLLRDNTEATLELIMRIYFAGTRSRPWVSDYENLSGWQRELVLPPQNSYRGGILSESAPKINVPESFYGFPFTINGSESVKLIVARLSIPISIAENLRG